MKYIELVEAVQTPVFTVAEVRWGGGVVYRYQLTRWVKKGYLARLRNGIYYFADKEKSIIPEEIAALLCRPSYISLEWALSHYGLIPEAAGAVTCVTSRLNRKYANKFGRFIYRHVKPELFWGYLPRKNSMTYLVAEPEKALLDYFYLNMRGLDTEKDLAALRLNSSVFSDIVNIRKLKKYATAFGTEKMKRITELCLRSIR